jgi:hypothetical protein
MEEELEKERWEDDGGHYVPSEIIFRYLEA